MSKTSPSNEDSILKAVQAIRNLPPQQRLSEELRALQILTQYDRDTDKGSIQYVLPCEWVEEFKEYTKGISKPPKNINYERLIRKIRSSQISESELHLVGSFVARFFQLLYSEKQELIKNEDIQKLFQHVSVDDTNEPGRSRVYAPESLTKPTISQIDQNSRTSPYGLHSSSSIAESNKASMEAERSITGSTSSIITIRGHDGDEALDDMYLEDEKNFINKRPLSRPAKTSHSPNFDLQAQNTTTNNRDRLLSFIQQFRLCSRTNPRDVLFESSKLVEIQKQIVELFGKWQTSEQVTDPLLKLYGQLSTQRPENINVLSNPGHYCYANSVVQLLFAIPQLVHYFKDSLPKVSSQDFPLLSAFQESVGEYFSNQMVLMDAFPLINAFKNKLDKGAREMQQDVDEFLRSLLDDLDRSLRKHLGNKGSMEEVTRLASIQTDSWAVHRTKAPSIITYLFTGEIKRTIVCMSCLASTRQPEPFECLPLDLDDKDLTLEQLFSNSVLPETIESGFDCESCKNKTPATILKSYSRLPPYLLVLLKRFRQDGSVSKDQRAVQVRDDMILDLSACSTDPNSKQYKLEGIIHHIGSMDNGHYKTTSFRPTKEKKDRWVLFDDGVMYSTEPTQFLKREAYILLFKRML